MTDIIPNDLEQREAEPDLSRISFEVIEAGIIFKITRTEDEITEGKVVTPEVMLIRGIAKDVCTIQDQMDWEKQVRIEDFRLNGAQFSYAEGRDYWGPPGRLTLSFFQRNYSNDATLVNGYKRKILEALCKLDQSQESELYIKATAELELLTTA